MSETYVITFRVRPAQRARFLALLNPVLDKMRHERTFRYAALHVDLDDENRFQLHETWTDRQDVLEVQLKRPYRQAWHAALDKLLECPRDIQSWNLLRSDAAARSGRAAKSKQPNWRSRSPGPKPRKNDGDFN
ncbi:MAG: antibiotic biosynthesis monooxygenase [Rhizobiales bacterium]|nr:antibiotic biosynthesis monooxygenase [Hyphomicrobiales bacterium]